MHKWTIVLFTLVLIFTAVYAYTHGGGTDANGGHYDSQTGEYHFHNQTSIDTPVETAPTAIPYLVPDFTEDTAYKVIRIVDGDTFIILHEGENTTVRLIGVDTPETKDPNKPVEDYGAEASMFTKNLLQGESVYIRFGADKRDIYGRLLAYAYRAPDGLFVNLEIVQQGYGKAYTDYYFEHIDLFRNYEVRARSAEKGLWGYQPKNNPVDLNSDGAVNILDLVIVANAFGN